MAASKGSSRERKDERKAFRVSFVLVLSSNSFGLLALRTTILILGPLWTIDIIRIHLLMLLLLLLCELLPILAFLGGQTFPLLTDRLRKIGLPLLLCDAIGGICLGLLAIFAALATEEDERVLRSLDIVFVALLWSALYLRC
jgi:hypothetical protein